MASAPISILISAKAYEHLRAECAISGDAALRAIGYGLVGSPFVTASSVRIVLAEQDARRLLAEVPVRPTLRDPLSQIACILNNRDSRRPLVRTGYPEVGSFVA